MSRLRKWAVTCFHLGEFPFAPGTVGSLGAVAVYMVGSLRFEGRVLSVFAGVCGALFAMIAIHLGRWAQAYYTSHDPSVFVLDEAAGQMVALVGVTGLVQNAPHWQVALLGFIFFRIFDVIKPPPVAQAERLRGGWGITLDDCLAGVYAAACVHLWIHFIG
jgi:phosphatidylglycerophosphatase A